MANKRRQFSIEEKLKILEAVDAGTKKGDVAKDFGISSSTLSTFIKDRKKILESFQKHSLGPKRKRMRLADFEDIDDAVYKWFVDIRSKNIPVSGPLIRQKALNFACLFNHEDFKASIGWLNRFRDRFGISSKVICGEAADVPEEALRDWRNGELKDVISGFDKNDIFNADETGVFYHLLPDRTLSVKGERCTGGKKSKARITALFCCNATGTEKLRPLVIGKSAKPRCFKNVKSLPCDYDHSNKAWMTEYIFGNWLKKLDEKMKKENRKILLLVDNCSAHNKPPRLQHVRVEYLPPNTTSVLQPLDQGIIRAVKANYRIRLLERILLNLERKVESKIDIKQAADMMVAAWNHVKQSTIVKCWRVLFENADENEGEKENEDQVMVDGALWRSVADATNIPTTVTFEDFVNVDNEISTSAELTDENILESILHTENPESDEEENTEHDEIQAVVTVSDAVKSLQNLRQFLSEKSDVPDSMFERLQHFEDFVMSKATEKCVQKRITCYFK